MQVEGAGLVRPAPVSLRFTSGMVERILAIAKERDEYRGYRKRSDSWGRGFVSNPTFVGLTGEYAVCRYLSARSVCNLQPDIELRKFGDGGCDIDAGGLVVQVKTRSSGTRNLIRRVDAKKRIRGLDCDAFVFASWDQKNMDVSLLGWIYSAQARLRGSHTRSSVATHWNLEVADDLLFPMKRLVEAILVRRGT